MSRTYLAAWVAATLVLATGSLSCGTSGSPQPLRNFDRPSDMTFTCYGDLNVGSRTLLSAQPLSSCISQENGEVPAGQEGVIAPSVFGFVLQPSLGTVAVVNVPALGVLDNDQLTPGLNDIPVGSLPVSMTHDSSGCFVMTANAGSCDVATINVNSALDLKRAAEVSRSPITTLSGAPILSRPRVIVSGLQTDIVGQECPAGASGLVYISYPDCNLVAAVEAASGVVQEALVFRNTGVVEIATEADFASCPVQCGDGAINVARAESSGEIEDRPVSLVISSDGSQLYVASESSPYFSIVDLDENGLLTANVRRIRVQGAADGTDVGLLNFSVTDKIAMGGDIHDSVVFPVGEFQFVYAIATDQSIRVIDIEHDQECDTQVDPRYLVDETDVEFLSCMPVGDLRTPPRREGAIGPGIQLPGRRANGRIGLASRGLPLDIAISTLEAPPSPPALAEPNSMIGTFAFVTAASGEVYIINVDDDGYADTADSSRPMRVSLPLALPHQLRDDVGSRDVTSENCSSPPTAEAGARISGAPAQIIDSNRVASSKVFEMPYFRGLACRSEPSPGTPGTAIDAIITELSFAAPPATRQASFGDLRVVEDQRWSVSWEGTLAADGRRVAIDGPVTRKAVVARDGNVARLQDASAPFCALGVEPYDIVSLEGCDPLLGDTQCAVGQTCYVHPETSASVRSGVCLSSDRVDELSGPCRDFITSSRRYSVTRSAKEELVLAERRRVLSTSPLGGCESASQCEEFVDKKIRLSLAGHPIETTLADPLPGSLRTFSWVCEADPSRSPGVDRCVMSCERTSDCEDGFKCSSEKRCVEALLPPAECLGAVQRYKVSAGEAFVVIGEDDGYLSALVDDPISGECIRPDNANPLQIGRIPLRPEPCDGDGDFSTGPNPCTTTIDHEDDYVPFVVEGDLCTPQDVERRTRQAPAVYFANPSMAFHLVDIETRGDLQCRADKAGQGPAYSTVYPGYQILFEITGGFRPKRVPGIAAAMPMRIVAGPTGNLWILDQGDSTTLDRGRLLRINPTKPGGFELTVLQ